MSELKKTRLPLPDEVVNYLQALEYELGGLKVLHTHALNAGTPAEKTAALRAQYQEKFSEYQLAKEELWARYRADYPDCKRWWVDFQTGLLHVEAPNE